MKQPLAPEGSCGGEMDEGCNVKANGMVCNRPGNSDERPERIGCFGLAEPEPVQGIWMGKDNSRQGRNGTMK